MQSEGLVARTASAGELELALRDAHERTWAILADLAPERGRDVLLHVNGFGGTPQMELYLLYHCAAERLRATGLRPVRSLVGSYTTSLDMAGASLTVTLLDDEMTALWDAPVRTAALRW
jgi:dihydroxyacetone kinase-like protein